jgi:hypothetical protein
LQFAAINRGRDTDRRGLCNALHFKVVERRLLALMKDPALPDGVAAHMGWSLVKP